MTAKLRSWLGGVAKRKITPVIVSLCCVLVIGGLAGCTEVVAVNQDQTTCQSQTTNLDVTGSNPEEQAFSFFVNNGFTAAQAAGIVGNLHVESGLNPQITNGIGAHGIAQWRGNRLNDLYTWAASQTSTKMKNPDYLLTQLTFVLHELDGSFSKVGVEVKAVQGNDAQAVYKVADIWNREYEVSGSSSQPRAAYGYESVFKRYAGQTQSGTNNAAVEAAAANDCAGGTTNATGKQKVEIDAAEQWLGTPYSFGGGGINGPSSGPSGVKGFDCSSLVQYALYKAGVSLPRTSEAQWDITKSAAVSMSNAQPGDLLFFSGSDGSMSAPGHVGIYLGGGKMINAPHTGAVVRIEKVNTSYWQSQLVGVTNPYDSSLNLALV